MLELIDNQPDLGVQDSEYQRLLGFPPDYTLEGRSRELADCTRQWFGRHGRPWIYARQTDPLELADARLRVGGTTFSSKRLHDQFSAAQAEHAVLVAVSAGRECEDQARDLWWDNKPDEYFFMEMFGSAVVEHLITTTRGSICAWADQRGMAVLPHFSPGYSGWDVSDQNKLKALIQPPDGRALPGELRVMDSGMLWPKKSLLAVFGVTAHVKHARQFTKLVPCETCSLNGCQYRRVPYRHSLPQIEDIIRLQGIAPLHWNGSRRRRLTQDAKYSLSLRALRKWAQERLELRILSDHSVEARFRYECTTCSSLGHPLEFHYHVKLAPPHEHYRIAELRCTPAPGDIGHTKQCEFQNDSLALTENIANDRPLLRRPLDEVLFWRREHSPSGCYCEAASRAHKWGLVFEVIHFALAQREAEEAPDMGNDSFVRL